MEKNVNLGKPSRVWKVIMPCIAVAIYSLSGFFTKLASRCEFLSLPYLTFLFCVLVVLGCYAVLWQMILKRIPLSRAYMFRSLGVIYGLLIACFAFGERITTPNILGCTTVMLGLRVLLSESSVKT